MSGSLQHHGLQHSITNSWSLLKLLSIELVILSNHLILCCPRLLLPSIFPSIRVFSNESALHMCPKYWSFSFSISPSNEYSGLISFRIAWFDLLAVQGTLNSLRQHRSSKASILWCSPFLRVQLSHPYMTTEKTTALTRWTFVGKVMSLLLNMLSRLGFPCGSAGKESTCNAGDLGSIPGLGRSPGEGKGYPLQYSGLENSMNCIVQGVAKSWTRLRDLHFHVH